VKKRKLKRQLDLTDPKQKAKFKRILAKVEKEFEPLVKANKESARITAEDLAITINCK
jgi:hypothetical protein